MDDDLRDLHDLFGDAPSSRAGDDEAAARLVIERALSGLGDAAVRARVLRWAIERFGGDAPAPHDAQALPPDARRQPKLHDPAVSVDDLADLFERPDELEE
jgi:hypothetical protein